MWTGENAGSARLKNLYPCNQRLSHLNADNANADHEKGGTADQVRLNKREDDLDVSGIYIRITPRSPRNPRLKEDEIE